MLSLFLWLIRSPVIIVWCDDSNSDRVQLEFFVQEDGSAHDNDHLLHGMRATVLPRGTVQLERVLPETGMCVCVLSLIHI